MTTSSINEMMVKYATKFAWGVALNALYVLYNLVGFFVYHTMKLMQFVLDSARQIANHAVLTECSKQDGSIARRNECSYTGFAYVLLATMLFYTVYMTYHFCKWRYHKRNTMRDIEDAVFGFIVNDGTKKLRNAVHAMKLATTPPKVVTTCEYCNHAYFSLTGVCMSHSRFYVRQHKCVEKGLFENVMVMVAALNATITCKFEAKGKRGKAQRCYADEDYDRIKHFADDGRTDLIRERLGEIFDREYAANQGDNRGSAIDFGDHGENRHAWIKEQVSNKVGHLLESAVQKPCIDLGPPTMQYDPEAILRRVQDEVQLRDARLGSAIKCESAHVSTQTHDDNKKAPKAKKERKIAESAVHGSAILDEGANNTAAAIIDGNHFQGYVTAGPTHKYGNAVFVTARHLDPSGNGDPVNHVSSTLEIFFYPDTQPTTVDCFVLAASYDKLVIAIRRTVATARFAKPRVGSAITAVTFDGKWRRSMGEIFHVTQHRVGYTMSTTAGWCRTPVYDSTGRIVAAHFSATMSAGGKNGTGGWVEDGKLPKKIEDFIPISAAEVQGKGKKKNDVQLQNEAYLLLIQQRRDAGNPFTLEEINKCAFDLASGKLDAAGIVASSKTEAHAPTQRKIYPLRQDFSTPSVHKRHVMMKPSLQMLTQDCEKFSEPVHMGATLVEMDRAVMDAVALDSEGHCPVTAPWVFPTLQEVTERISTLLTGEHTAGANGEMTQRDYIKSLAQDPTAEDAEFEGLIELAKRTIAHMKNPCDDTDFGKPMHQWVVIGKKDGYKLDKIEVGRSILASSTNLKAYWLAVFGPSDARWKNSPWYSVGEDHDLPLPAHEAESVRSMKQFIALDATAFDRRMTSVHIESFMQYMMMMNPGVPRTVVHDLTRITCVGTMILPDGTQMHKPHGNPSGHPATLRLNCVCNAISWLVVLAKAFPNYMDMLWAGDLRLEICGDDSRLGLKQPQPDLEKWVCEIMKVWTDNFPWKMKVEGTWQRDEGTPFCVDCLGIPPFISRGILEVDGILWMPPIDPSRMLRKLVHDMGRNDEQERILVSSLNSILSMLDYWDDAGKIICPAVRDARKHIHWSTATSYKLAADRYKHHFM